MKKYDEREVIFLSCSGLNEVVPVQALKIFDEKEFELLLVGVAELDVDDWEASVRLAILYCSRRTENSFHVR